MKVKLEIDLEQLAIISAALTSLDADIKQYDRSVNINKFKVIREFKPIGGNDLRDRIHELKTDISNQINK